MKKSVIKNLSISIAGLLAIGVITFGASSFSDHKKDNINVALAYEGTPLPTSGTLSAGTYYLSSDLTVSSQLKITSGNVIVNLNGHTLNGGGRDKGIFHVTGGTLTVNGKDDATGNRGALNNGGGYYPGSGYSYGGALYITAGAATLSDLDITNCQSNWGGAIHMSNAAVTLNNCNLSNNIDTNGYGFYGAISIGDSSSAGNGLTVNGGEMYSNNAAIYLGSKAKATINGVYIHDNDYYGLCVSTNEGEGGLKISGDTIIKDNNPSSGNLKLNNSSAAKIGIVSELGDDAYIGVTISGDTKGVFTNSTDTSLNDASKFVSDDSGYAVGKNDNGQLYLGPARTVTYSTAHGTAPDPIKVLTGSTINEPTAPTAEDYIFLGWYKESTFENAWDFATDTVNSDITLYAKWLAHTHSFTYSALGNTITATCANTDGNCPLPDCEATLTVTGPSGSSSYDGTTKEAVITDTSNGVAFSNIQITYYKQGDTSFTGLPIDAGTYIALVSFDESTLRASIQYDILKVASSVTTAPTANSLTMKGYEQELVSAGTASGGTMVYSLDGITFSESIPTATDIGEYTVYYKVIGDANHNDSEVYTVIVTIEQATATITKGTEVTYYDSFDDAVSHWEDGSTLTLLKDVTVSTTTTINNNVTLDLNGYGIRLTNTDTRLFYINSGKTLTINDSDSNHAHAITLSNWRGTSVTDGTGTTSVNDGSGTAYINGGYITGGYSTSSSIKEGIAFYINGGTLVLNGGTIIGNYVYVSNCRGAGVYMASGSHLRMYDTAALIYNYSQNSAAAIEAVASYVEIYGGVIAHNKSDLGSGTAISAAGATSIKLYGSVIEDNSTKDTGAISLASYDLSADQYFGIAGSPTVNNNYSWNNNNAPANITLYTKAHIEGPLTNTEKIGINLSGNGANNIWNDGKGCFTIGWSTYMAGKDPRDYFFSDNSDYIIGLNADGEVVLDSPRTVTYSTAHGTAPDSDTVASGSIIQDEPTSPTAEGYDFMGWFKDEEFINVWDYATDVVTADTTIYAKWIYDAATQNVIDLINNIGDLSYSGGADDSLDDIIAAKVAYDALTPGRKEVVNGVNIDILNHDIIVYNHVDSVGDLIKAIPDPSNSQEYYEAVDTARAAYNALTEEEKAILNTDINFDYEQILEDNIAAEEVIKLIDEIGDITYNGGDNDSKDDIKAAEDAYNALSDDQKELVANVNKDDLDDARETYDDVDEAVNLINSIGDVTHGGGSDSKEDIEAAREAYDKLSEEAQALVDSYNNSDKVLDDAEHVYDAMEAIDSIGDVDYDSESKDAIDHAREIYDSLSEDQKHQLGDDYLKILTNAEDEFDSLEHQADILYIVLLFIASLALVGGLGFLYFLIKRKKDNKDDDDQNNGNVKKQPVKAYSIGGILPGIMLSSLYLSTKYIILYVLIGLAIIVWISCLVLVLTKKKAKAVSESTKEDIVKTENREDEEEVATVTDEKGNIFQIRFIKSFTAKLIQSPDETKKYYEELKNFVLSYKKTNTRISWNYDSINSGRNQVLKFAIRGKTLCVYLPLDADKYNDTKYKVEKVESRKYEGTPCLYRIKNDRRLGYAKDLIASVCESLELVKGEEQHEIYANLPYEENKPLIARGLIKELKVQVNKPVESVVLETKVSADGDEIVTTKDAKGNIFEIRYIKSFTAKLSQSSDEVKEQYNELKNYVLSYKDTHSRVSWHYDAINVGRDYILKFAIRGKTLCVYYSLDASKLDDKYKVEEAKGKKYEDVPCLYRIRNDRRLGYAKDLIDLLMNQLGINNGKESTEDFRIKYESTKALLAKGLIKELKTKVSGKQKEEVLRSISVQHADTLMSDEKAEALIEEGEESPRRVGQKDIINIDTLSQNYNDGDEVTLDSLIKKKLVSPKTGYVKVLARGTLDKKLNVVLNDFSLQAVKMIVLLGGHVKKIK